MLGFPEARIPLANVVIQLALSQKSNSALIAIDNVLTEINKNPKFNIPNYLKDGHYNGAKELGRSVGYKYPHDYPNNYVVQQYLPDNLVNKKFYEPNVTNKNEKNLKLYNDFIKNLK